MGQGRDPPRRRAAARDRRHPARRDRRHWFGLVSALDVARQQIGMPLENARVVIQGFGSVGKHAARFLADKGAVLVAASDTRGTIVDENGLDVPALIALKGEGKALHDY